LDVEELPKLTRVRRAAGYETSPRKRRILPRLQSLQRLADRRHRPFEIAGEVRSLEPHALERLRESAHHPAQARVVRKRAQERLRPDQFGAVTANRIQRLEQQAVARKERIAARPPNRFEQILLWAQAFAQGSRCGVRSLWRGCLNDRQNQVLALRKRTIDHDLALTPRQCLRQKLAAVGSDRKIMGEIKSGDYCEQQETADHEQRMARADRDDPRNNFDPHSKLLRRLPVGGGAHMKGEARGVKAPSSQTRLGTPKAVRSRTARNSRPTRPPDLFSPASQPPS